MSVVFDMMLDIGWLEFPGESESVLHGASVGFQVVGYLEIVQYADLGSNAARLAKVPSSANALIGTVVLEFRPAKVVEVLVPFVGDFALSEQAAEYSAADESANIETVQADGLVAALLERIEVVRDARAGRERPDDFVPKHWRNAKIETCVAVVPPETEVDPAAVP